MEMSGKNESMYNGSSMWRSNLFSQSDIVDFMDFQKYMQKQKKITLRLETDNFPSPR